MAVTRPAGSSGGLAGRGARWARGLAGEFREAFSRERDCRRARPRTGTLFLTYRCSSKCTMCRMWKRVAAAGRELDLAAWTRVVDMLNDNGVRVVELFGGDVLLRKDVLFPLLRHLRRLGAVVHMPTNGNFLDRETAETLLENCVSHVYLSIDGVGAVQNAIRGMDDSFSRVVRAARILIDAKKRSGGTTKIVCNTTVSRDNVADLEAVARFAASEGFDEIHFEYIGEFTPELAERSVVHGVSADPYYVKEGESKLLAPADVPLLRQTLKRIRREFGGGGIRVYTINIDMQRDSDLVDGTPGRGRCYMERTEVVVDPYGGVIPCPFVSGYQIGRLPEQAFGDVWNNARHRSFREVQNAGLLPLCRGCIYSVQRNHALGERLRRIVMRRIS